MSLETNSFEFGEFLLDAKEKVLLRDGKPLGITPKAFQLLQILVENHGHLVERGKLIKAIWAESFVEEGNLTVTVRHLRKALDDNKQNPRFIETVSKRGYRFVAQVNLIETKEKNNGKFELIESKPFSTTVKEPYKSETQSSGVVITSADWQPETETNKKEEFDWEKEDYPPKSKSVPAKSFIRNSFYLIGLGLILVLGSLSFGFYFLLNNKNFKGQPSINLFDTGGKVTIATISPNGKTIVFAQKEGIGESLWRKEINTDEPTRILPPQEVEVIGLTVSPSNDYVYFSVFSKNSTESSLSRIPLRGGEAELVSGIAADISVSFSPDGKSFAFTESRVSLNETYLKTANSDGTNQKKLLTTRGDNRKFIVYRANPVAWSPDGSVIACAVRDTDENGVFYKILLVNPNDGSEKVLSKQRWDFVEHIAWKDDENLAVINNQPASPLRQIWLISQKTGEARQLTHDLKHYQWLSAANGHIFAVQKNPHSVLQIADFSDDIKTWQSKVIYSESGRIQNVNWGNESQIFYNSWASGKNEIWRVNSDGTAPKQLTTNSNLTYEFAVSPVDNRLVFSAAQKGTISLFVADSDGQNIRQITNGGDLLPRFMPDGKQIIFQRGATPNATIWLFSPDKNQPPKQLTGYFATHPEISPDGRTIAYQFMDFADNKRRWKIGLMDSKEGRLLNKIDFPVLITERRLVWHPNDNRLTMIAERGENTSLLFLSPGDGKYEVIENFSQGKISSFAWSSDGTRLAFSQVHETSDVVILSNF